MLSLLTKQALAKAKIVRWNQTPCLMASFSASTPPMVWQLDLEKLTNYTINVVEKDGAWDLGYTTPPDGFVLIARFDERDDAEFAYGVIQKALLKGSPSTYSCRPTVGISFGKILLWGVVIFAVWFLVSSVISGIKGQTDELDASFGSNSAQMGTPLRPEDRVISAEPQKIQNGVPMSADDVLPKD